MDFAADLTLFIINFFVFFVIYFIIFVLVLIFALVLGGAPIALQNKSTGHTKVLRPRFSFTYYFFGAWTPLFRGHWISFAIALVIDIFTIGIGRLVYAFFINKYYIQYLKEKGYEVINQFDPNGGFGQQQQNQQQAQNVAVVAVEDGE